MLKRIALCAAFVLASAFTVAPVGAAAKSTNRGSTINAPSAPQPKGFCFPGGFPC
jgi:hypothetical protein